MKTCRKCQHEVSEQTQACPQCGAPFPANEQCDGWGYEYKSGASFLGLPLVHISFKYGANRAPRPAVGVLAIGQFACGVVTISQFGLGVVSVGQITLAGFALTQIGVAYSLIAQVGLYIHEGYGQVVKSVGEVLGLL